MLWPRARGVIADAAGDARACAPRRPSMELSSRRMGPCGVTVAFGDSGVSVGSDTRRFPPPRPSPIPRRLTSADPGVCAPACPAGVPGSTSLGGLGARIPDADAAAAVSLSPASARGGAVLGGCSAWWPLLSASIALASLLFSAFSLLLTNPLLSVNPLFCASTSSSSVMVYSSPMDLLRPPRYRCTTCSVKASSARHSSSSASLSSVSMHSAATADLSFTGRASGRLCLCLHRSIFCACPPASERAVSSGPIGAPTPPPGGAPTP